MKLRLKMNTKFGSNHCLGAGTEIESDENGLFPDYVNENRDLFEEVVGSNKPVDASAGPDGTAAGPAKPAAKKDKATVTPSAKTSTITEKQVPESKPVSKAAALIKRGK